MEDNFQDLPLDFESVLLGPNQRPGAIFRLFDLPTELWLRICELAMLQSHSIDPTRAKQLQHQERIVKQAAITQTCKLLRQETLPLFYRHNQFEIYHWEKTACVRKWLVEIGAANRKNMGTLVFHAMFGPEFWAEKFKDIGIDVNIESAEDQNRVAGKADFESLSITFT